ncbi:MAG: hypothetical protein ACXWJM_15345, partial [Ramlibacter sp.]
MSKLLSILLAGAFAAGTAVAQTAPPTGSDKNTGTLSGSGTASTRSATTAPGAGSGAIVSGDGTGKTTATGGSTGNTTATMGSKSGTTAATTTTASPALPATEPSGSNRGQPTGAMGASGDTGFCPPGLDKKDNNCMPPGQAKKSGTSSMAKDKVM